VYELPPAFNLYINPVRLDRPIFRVLWPLLLSSGARTSIGQEADYFYVPYSLRGRHAGTEEEVIDYVRQVRLLGGTPFPSSCTLNLYPPPQSQTWPFWNRTQGRRHLFVHEGDWGRGELRGKHIKQILSNSTFLHLWGLHTRHELHGPAAHSPGLDIVLPVLANVNGVASLLNPLAPRINKTIMFFHAGSICRDGQLQKNKYDARISCMDVLANGTDDDFKAERWSYSGGVRQYVYRYFRNLPDYKIVKVSC